MKMHSIQRNYPPIQEFIFYIIILHFCSFLFSVAPKDKDFQSDQNSHGWTIPFVSYPFVVSSHPGNEHNILITSYLATWPFLTCSSLDVNLHHPSLLPSVLNPNHQIERLIPNSLHHTILQLSLNNLKHCWQRLIPYSLHHKSLLPAHTDKYSMLLTIPRSGWGFWGRLSQCQNWSFSWDSTADVISSKVWG